MKPPTHDLLKRPKSDLEDFAPSGSFTKGQLHDKIMDTPLDDPTFGTLQIDPVRAMPRATRKVWASVPRALYASITQNATVSEFINEAVLSLNKIQEVVDAGFRLVDLRAELGGDNITMGAAIPAEQALLLQRAVTHTKAHYPRANVNFLVGGCVMLLSEERRYV